MNVIESGKVVCFDVDDTLVLHSPTLVPEFSNSGFSSTIKYKPAEAPVNFEIFGIKRGLTPHQGHINQLKIFHGRGYHVIVWSAQGWEWALEVVKQLELRAYVHTVMEKPLLCVDDKPVDQWLNRIYLGVNGGSDTSKD